MEWNGKRYAVTNIEEKAFANSEGLMSVVIPESVNRIGDESFFGCLKLKSIIIPDTDIQFGENVFKGCGIKIEENIELDENGNLTDSILYYETISETEVEVCGCIQKTDVREIEIPSVIEWKRKRYKVSSS